MNIEITLKELNGKQIPAVTSLQVAEAFGKEHRHVLRDIRETIDKCSESFTAPNFGLSEYTDSTGRKLSDLGARMGLSPRIKEDSQYGTVKIHHVEVIEALRLALKQDHNLLGKYRKMKAA